MTSTNTAPAPAAAGGADEGQDDELRTAVDGWPARLAGRLRPPEPWRYRPASLAAMWRYARIGAWTRDSGLLRFAGVWYFRLVALPTAVVTHYLAWLTQRPSRLGTALVIYVVLAHVGPLRHLLWWPSWL